MALAALVLGAFLAAIVCLWSITPGVEWRVVSYERVIVVPSGEATQIAVDWSRDDSPDGASMTLISGERELFWADPHLEVEWLCPHVQGKSTLLLTGRSPGETRFELVFPRSHRRLILDVDVREGQSHLEARARRREVIARQADPARLIALARQHARHAEALAAGPDESAPGRALLACALATDHARAACDLHAREGAVPAAATLLLQRCEEREARARDDHEALAGRLIAHYRDTATLGDRQARVAALQRALRGISHECDPEYMRLRAILQDVWETRDPTTTARCDLAAFR